LIVGVLVALPFSPSEEVRLDRTYPTFTAASEIFVDPTAAAYVMSKLAVTWGALAAEALTRTFEVWNEMPDTIPAPPPNVATGSATFANVTVNPDTVPG